MGKDRRGRGERKRDKYGKRKGDRKTENKRVRDRGGHT